MDSVNETYEWYADTGLADVPMDTDSYTAEISDASTFSNVSGSNSFSCVDNDPAEHVMNAVNVSWTYPNTVNSTDSVLVHFRSTVGQKQFWFMIGNIEIWCLGLFHILYDLRLAAATMIPSSLSFSLTYCIPYE